MFTKAAYLDDKTLTTDSALRNEILARVRGVRGVCGVRGVHGKKIG